MIFAPGIKHAFAGVYEPFKSEYELCTWCGSDTAASSRLAFTTRIHTVDVFRVLQKEQMQDVKKSISKKSERKLPNFNQEDHSLENLATQDLVYQYLCKFPDHLGGILSTCPPKVRSKAIASLHMRDVASVKIPIEDMMKGSPIGTYDEIRFVAYDNDDCPDYVKFDIIWAATMDERVRGVLNLWLEDFYKKYPDPESRAGYVERDGSAILDLDSGLGGIQDYVERYVEDVCADRYAAAEYGGHPDDENDNGYDDDSEAPDFDDEVERIIQEFRNVFDSLPVVGESNVVSKKVGLFRPVPKITIHYLQLV